MISDANSYDGNPSIPYVVDDFIKYRNKYSDEYCSHYYPYKTHFHYF